MANINLPNRLLGNASFDSTVSSTVSTVVSHVWRWKISYTMGAAVTALALYAIISSIFKRSNLQPPPPRLLIS